jgi:Domain of unknown function (DUF4123)
MEYILLDSAQMGVYINAAFNLNKKFDSLYRGQIQTSLSLVAPYLFSFDENREFSKWIISNWGNSWGTIVGSNWDFETCWKHFRKFLIVKKENKEEFYFRFYDPRVLTIFLPTCDRNQVIDFFGPIDYFIVEGTSKNEGIEFTHHNGNLKQEKIFITEKLLVNTIN